MRRIYHSNKPLMFQGTQYHPYSWPPNSLTNSRVLTNQKRVPLRDVDGHIIMYFRDDMGYFDELLFYQLDLV